MVLEPRVKHLVAIFWRDRTPSTACGRLLREFDAHEDAVEHIDACNEDSVNCVPCLISKQSQIHLKHCPQQRIRQRC